MLFLVHLPASSRLVDTSGVGTTQSSGLLQMQDKAGVWKYVCDDKQRRAAAKGQGAGQVHADRRKQVPGANNGMYVSFGGLPS